MVRYFKNVGEWLSECRSIVRQDLDNVILFTGAEGSGKSTLMYQVMKALDPNFSLDQIGFSVKDYIRIAKQSPKFAAVASDEFLVNRRKAMRRDTVDLLDFLQECRGLNLHHALCFPHVDLLDRAILDYRVRWHVYIPKRGLFQVKERVKWYKPGGVEEYSWRVVGAWNYRPNSGAEWQAYQDAKMAHMMRDEGEEESEESAFDLDFLRTLPLKYQEAIRATTRKL